MRSRAHPGSIPQYIRPAENTVETRRAVINYYQVGLLRPVL